MENKDVLREKLKLYLICGEGDTPESVIEKTEKALVGGVTAVQLRAKTWDARVIYETAKELRILTWQHDALLLVNDWLGIAMAAGADGVHLGQKDLPIAKARKNAWSGCIIGGTARTPELALQAQSDGADYIGCGSAFPTGTKSDAVVIGPEGIAKTLRAISIPGVAIGGITLENIGELANCGCAGVAVSAAIMKANDVRQAAVDLKKKIETFF